MQIQNFKANANARPSWQMQAVERSGRLLSGRSSFSRGRRPKGKCRMQKGKIQKANGTISSPEETGFAHSKLVSELKLDCLLKKKNN